jgi:hypothetical protein
MIPLALSTRWNAGRHTLRRGHDRGNPRPRPRPRGTRLRPAGRAHPRRQGHGRVQGRPRRQRAQLLPRARRRTPPPSRTLHPRLPRPPRARIRRHPHLQDPPLRRRGGRHRRRLPLRQRGHAQAIPSTSCAWPPAASSSPSPTKTSSSRPRSPRQEGPPPDRLPRRKPRGPPARRQGNRRPPRPREPPHLGGHPLRTRVRTAHEALPFRRHPPVVGHRPCPDPRKPRLHQRLALAAPPRPLHRRHAHPRRRSPGQDHLMPPRGKIDFPALSDFARMDMVRVLEPAPDTETDQIVRAIEYPARDVEFDRTPTGQRRKE